MCLNDGRGAPSRVQRADARRWLRALCVGLSCASVAPAQAELLPLWEAGGGASALNLRDYRGSEQSHRYLLPVPWFVYRGEVFKADRDGVRARLFDSDRVDLDVSINGSVPVRSSDNRARRGMPDLNPTLEIGPVLNVTLWRLGDDRRGGTKLDFRLPVRVGVTHATAGRATSASSPHPI